MQCDLHNIQMQYQVFNQLKYALTLSLTPDADDALNIIANLSTKPNYIQLLTHTIADHSLNSDLHVAAVISLKNHLDKESTPLLDEDGMHILSFAMEYLRPSTLQLWRQMIRIVTSKINANSINFSVIVETLLNHNLSTNQYGFYLQLVSGVIEGGIQEGNSSFTQQILDLLETLLRNSTCLQTRYYIFSTLNNYALLRVIGQVLHEWIGIYRQTLQSLSLCDHYFVPNLKRTIYEFLKNAVPILFQNSMNPKVMSGCLEVMLTQISVAEFYPQHLQFINKMNIYYPSMLEFYAYALKRKLLHFMIYSEQQQFDIRYSPVAFINSTNQLRKRAYHIWVNLPRIKHSRSKTKQSQTNIKNISFVVLDLLINGTYSQQIVGLQLLMGIKSTINKSNAIMIMKVCILSKLFTAQPLSSLAVKALATFSEGLKVIDLMDSHLHRLKQILLSEQFSYDKYIMYSHLSSLINHKQISELVVLHMGEILSQYVRMMCICPTVNLISALEELLKRLIQFVGEQFITDLIMLKIEQQYYQMIIKMIVNIRKHHTSWNLTQYINMDLLLQKYQQNYQFNSLLQLIKIYFYDSKCLNEGDWLALKAILQVALAKDVDVFPVIYIIRVFFSKKGNEWLFKDDGEYCCLLFEYVMHLMKKYSNDDDEFLGCLLIPIYMVENYHRQLSKDLLQGFWSIANSVVQYLQNQQNQQLEQTCTSLIALLIWENSQLAFTFNKGKIYRILNQFYNFNLSKPIVQKRIVLGISSILVANLPRKYLQQLMSLLQVLMDLYDNALASSKPKSIRVNRCDDLFEEIEGWDDSVPSDVQSEIDSDYGMVDVEGYNNFYESKLSEINELEYCAECIEFAEIPEIREKGRELFEFVIEHYQSL